MSLLADVRAYLDQQGKAYEQYGDTQLVNIYTLGSYSWWELTVEERPGEVTQLIVFGLPAVIVPASKRPACMRLICRLNAQLSFGRWELSAEHGELRFRTALSAQGTLTNPNALIDPLLTINMFSVEDHLVAFLALCFGELEPEAALAKATLTHTLIEDLAPLHAFCAMLRQNEWDHTLDEPRRQVHLSANLDGALWSIIVTLRDALIIESSCKLIISPDQLEDALTLTTALNFNISSSHWVLDLDSGELCFRTSIASTDPYALQGALLYTALMVNISSAARWFKPFEQLCLEALPLAQILAQHTNEERVSAR